MNEGRNALKNRTAKNCRRICENNIRMDIKEINDIRRIGLILIR